ncbi:MAG: metal ABC transporter substrate-binding protein [Candidatus Faecousia sp.]|nr:metal ABC transporter substrate-binding protein [Clostridiales bacterium]MDY6179873.1 metal ABC transporter substrate-binding protein [Candidatus Faecousia sp.]
MKKTAIILLLALVLAGLPGCASEPPAQIAATTLPVYEFTQELCLGTPLTVTRLVTEQVSCLHDYSLNVRQVKAAEAAEILVISGAGLEDFMEDLLTGKPRIDASQGIDLLCGEEHEAEHEHEHDHGHTHESDPHIWLSPILAQRMARNICAGLAARYPDYSPIFEENLTALCSRLEELQEYGEEALGSLSCRELITFHDGFSYFAEAFGLTILEAVEEESGSEASAGELIHLIELTREHHLPAIFTERNSSASAASVISRETGAGIFELDMAMAGDSYFEAMYRNLDTIKEALR